MIASTMTGFRPMLAAALATVLLLLVMPSADAQSIDASPSSESRNQLEDAYESAGEAAILAAIKKYLGTDLSVQWILVRVINAIPGDSPRFEPVQFDPSYATLTMGQLQERLGYYIVARQEVAKLSASPGQLASLKALDEEIDQMKTESAKRAKHTDVQPK